MSELRKTLESGALLEVSMASFEEANKLMKAVMKELETVNISLGIKSKSFKELFELEITDETLNTVKNLFSRIIGSSLIEEVLWPCMGRATYDGVKITRDTFEDEKARGDYLIVAKEVIWFNLTPFVRNLGSLFQGLKAKSTDTLK